MNKVLSFVCTGLAAVIMIALVVAFACMPLALMAYMQKYFNLSDKILLVAWPILVVFIAGGVAGIID